MKLFIVTIAILAMTTQAFAEADYDPDKYKDPVVTKPPPTTTTTTTTTTPPVTAGFGANPGQSTINQGSNVGQASQSSGSGANAAAGAALMAAGAALMANPPTAPQGAMLMAMGILAMMQSGHDGDAAGQSGNTGLASIQGNGLNPTTTSTTSTDPTAATGTSAFTDAKIAEGKAALTAQGYKMGPDGSLTTPDGSTIPASAYNSPSSMAAAGMSPQTIADAQKIVSDAEKDSPKVSGVGLNSAGGGGDGMAVSEGEGTGEANATGGFAANPFNLNADAKAKLIAGKTVMFDGEPIGVRGLNIFDMVHTCYQKKRKGNQFIETEYDVGVRSPASLKRRK